MLEVVNIIALIKLIQPLMTAARLFTRQGRIRHRLPHIEQKTQLDSTQPLGIESLGAIVQPDLLKALLQRLNLGTGRLHS